MTTPVPALRRPEHVGRRLRAAEGVERHVYTAAGQLHDRLHGVRLARVDNVGGAEPVGELQLMVVDVDRDDPAGVQQPGALDHVEPDAAAPEHGDRHAGCRGWVVDHRAHAGRDRAADQRRHLGGHAVGNRIARLLRRDHRLSEHAELGHLVDVVVTVVQPDRAVELPPARRHVGVADVGIPRAAGPAVSAVGDEGHDAPVAGLYRRHAGADLHDRAGSLVSQHRRQRERRARAGDDVVVAGAYPRGARLDADFARLRRVLRQLSDLQVPVALVQYCCLHV